MKVANLGSKRQPSEQKTSFSTPSREHSSSRQKTSETASATIPIIGDIQVSLIASKAGKDGEIWHRGLFNVTLSNKKRCRVSSNKEDWMGHQYTGVMDKLQNLIVTTAKLSGLDMSSLYSEPAMTSHLPWKLAWITLENIVLEDKLKTSLLSSTALNREDDKISANKDLAWSIGTEFLSKQSKYNAKARVLKELESVSGKELKKAELILSSIVFGLTKEPGFEERAVLSNDTRKKLSTMESCILRAGTALRSLVRSANLGSMKVLTAVTAVLAPADCVETNSQSCQNFCDTLGLNPKSKYVELGIENRKLYDSFLMLDGDIAVGEHVTYRSSPVAIVTDIRTNGSVTVKLLPFGNEKKFRSFASGKIRRLEPELDNYQRKTRFDTTPQHVKTTIEDFIRRHVPISPNKLDIVKRRHPQHPAMFETKQAMLRYQTMNKLWQQFLE